MGASEQRSLCCTVYDLNLSLMSRSKRLLALLEKVTSVGISIAFGAFLLLLYIDFAMPDISGPLRNTKDAIMASIWVLLLIHGLTSRGRLTSSDQPEEPSPRASGLAVILLTGFAAAYWMSGSLDGERDYIRAALVLVLTLVSAIWLWRFATTNAGQIGEAKFDTDGER